MEEDLRFGKFSAKNFSIRGRLITTYKNRDDVTA